MGFAIILLYFILTYRGVKTALKSENASLKETNDELKRALVRSAINPAPATTEQPKTEEQLYKEKIADLSKRTLERMSKI